MTTTPRQSPDDGKEQGSAGHSPVNTLALFAGVIGVVVGWALQELTAWIRRRGDAARLKSGQEKQRVLECIHTAEELSTTANGISVAYAAAASGRAADPEQLSEMAGSFNEAQLKFVRLRMELAILGPGWAADDALAVENRISPLQAAMRRLESTPTRSAAEELLGEINAFRESRTKMIRDATTHYGAKDEATARGSDQPQHN